MDVIVTDLDGTLLDARDYSFAEAAGALALIRERRIPLVFCTSKTRAETERWREALGNRDPFITENGGALFAPPGLLPVPEGATRRGEYVAIELGAPYAHLVSVLGEASRESRCRIRGFAEMQASEVAEACSMSLADAELAKQREYDEPFLILDSSRERHLLDAIEERGLKCSRGGRFRHITGRSDKAAAVRILIDLYRRAYGGIRTIGLGDGPNDAAFLECVDAPFIIRSPLAGLVAREAPRAAITESEGVRGWNQAILRLFAEKP